MQAAPEIHSVWRNKTDKNEYITIVDQTMSNCSRKKIVYRYHRTNHIGGCYTSEWFYSDWDPV